VASGRVADGATSTATGSRSSKSRTRTAPSTQAQRGYRVVLASRDRGSHTHPTSA